MVKIVYPLLLGLIKRFFMTFHMCFNFNQIELTICSSAIGSNLQFELSRLKLECTLLKGAIVPFGIHFKGATSLDTGMNART